MNIVRWIDMKLAPDPGQVLRLRPGHWNPEPSLDMTLIALHREFPKWKALDHASYRIWKKAELPTHWVVVEKRWHPEAQQVFIRLVSMGEREVLGWCQYLYEHFDWVKV